MFLFLVSAVKKKSNFTDEDHRSEARKSLAVLVHLKVICIF